MKLENKKRSLFREEVLRNKKNSFFGNVIVSAPISFALWAVITFSFSIMIICFLVLGSYSRRYEASGLLEPDKGIVHIHASKNGTIIKTFVKHGDFVNKDDLIFLISTDQHSESEKGLAEKQIISLKNQIAVQKEKLVNLKQSLEKYQLLFKKKLVSEIILNQRRNEVLSAKLALHDLQYRLNEIIASGSYAVKAPCEGTISTIDGYTGTRLTEQKLLVSIIPSGALLKGTLYVPADSIGFIQKGQKVFLKYRAFPYQQFGLYESVIETIDKSILSPDDIKTVLKLNMPFYKVMVRLKEQNVRALGKDVHLVSGMIFDAVIHGEKRTLWQWIMNPLYNLRGDLSYNG